MDDVGTGMTLSEVLQRLYEFDSEMTIYAAGGADATLTSSAVVAEEPADGGVPEEARGLDYLLEVFLAREVLEDWQRFRGGELSLDEAHRVIVHYARYDAHPVQ